MNLRWTPDIEPAMITDDIAFVGGNPVSVHCLLSDDGLILLDTGYPGMLDGICENMNKLGLHIKDVRYILHSHGHIDHYGCTAEIIKMTGAKTLIGYEDADIVLGKADLSWAKELKLDAAESFVPDVLFRDNEVLQLGMRTIRCIHAPGHTAGTYAFLIDTQYRDQKLIAAMHGGVGLNSMSRVFLNLYGLPLDCRENFRSGLHRLLLEHVDIVLGNHPDQNDTAGKIARFDKNCNPFIDVKEWSRFLQESEYKLDSMLCEESAKYGALCSE